MIMRCKYHLYADDSLFDAGTLQMRPFQAYSDTPLLHFFIKFVS